jgi:hypothetical protein
MTDTTTHGLPPLLAAAANYAVDQPDLDTLEAAFDSARTGLHMIHESARESVRLNFIRRQARGGHEMEQMTESHHTAALVQYGDAGYLLGFATCWLMLKGGRP